MSEQEIVIRYRMPSVPADVEEDEKGLIEDAQRNFAGQIINIALNYMNDNGVEFISAKKRLGHELAVDNLNDRRSREISVPEFLAVK